MLNQKRREEGQQLEKNRNRIDIEYVVNKIEEDVRNGYDLPDDWYGDTYGSLIETSTGLNILTKMQFCSDEDYEDYLNELKENFEREGKSYCKDN